MPDADRSAIEIKILLRNLDPTKTNIKHKDRLRKLQKFRQYVSTNPPPEFYDDDYPMLLLGSESPTADEDEDLMRVNLFGLVRAVGCPSSDHKDSLKRSARPAISLLKYLCLDFDGAGEEGILGDLNGFAAAFCALTTPQLRNLKLNIHIGTGDAGGSRGGSKDDACQLLALLLARHTDTDYETPKALNLSDLLPNDAERAEFQKWLDHNVGADVRAAIKKMESARVNAAGTKSSSLMAAGGGAGDGDDEDDDDVLGAFGGKKVLDRGGVAFTSTKTGKSAMGNFDLEAKEDKIPTRWSESEMATENKERAAGAIFLEEEKERAIEEKKKAEEEKRRLIARDPLGIRVAGRQFDLLDVETNRERVLQEALDEIEGDIERELALANQTGVERVNWLEAQRQALLAVIERANAQKDSGEDKLALMNPDVSNSAGNGLPSILPTSPNFDPVLFLTAVHRNASFQELQDSTSRLSRKTDTQVERLQNLVRDNFALFIKCSEGIDIFGSNASDNEGMKQLSNQFKTLDNLADSCSDQARKSFKPLLDNTNEVRKVQSALAVLQRVAPLLTVPGLMRQHIENANFSAVVKAYRKVLVIDKYHFDVELLRYVRTKAAEAAQDARHDLELILADETSSASSLLDAIRDLGELLELLEKEGDLDGSSNKGNTGGSTPRSSGQNSSAGVFTIDKHRIRVRNYPPALACLLLQCTHFRSLVEKAITNTESTTERLFRGEGPDGFDSASVGSLSDSKLGEDKRNSSDNSLLESTASQRSRDKRWKYDVLESRVAATLRSVSLAKSWLPRLLQIGLATLEAEKRQAARRATKKAMSGGGKGSSKNDENKDENDLTVHKVFGSIVTPTLRRLVEHTAFCALGCANQGSKFKLGATFGKSSSERLQMILKSPLPPTQTTKCAIELADLAAAIQESNDSMFSLRPLEDDEDGAKQRAEYKSPLEGCMKMANDAVVMIERRVCIYSFDACARKCSLSASGSGTFDGESLLQCVQKLSEDLTRPEDCSSEVEKGSYLVVQKCCEGLTSYIKDRSDAARLRVVAECNDALNTTIVDVVREVSYLTNDQSDSLDTNLSALISTLETDMFDVFLDSVKKNVASCAKLGLIESTAPGGGNKQDESMPFPPYLAGKSCVIFYLSRFHLLHLDLPVLIISMKFILRSSELFINCQMQSTSRTSSANGNCATP
ncbi:hypothetical protein ACHAXS_010203 [Conticribra weissflogii]